MSMRRTPASSVSPVCMGAPAGAPIASVPPASLAPAANKVTAQLLSILFRSSGAGQLLCPLTGPCLSP